MQYHENLGDFDIRRRTLFGMAGTTAASRVVHLDFLKAKQVLMLVAAQPALAADMNTSISYLPAKVLREAEKLIKRAIAPE